MIRIITEKVPNIEIKILNEQDALDDLGAKSLMLRIFMAMDALEDVALVESTFEAGGHVVTDFSGFSKAVSDFGGNGLPGGTNTDSSVINIALGASAGWSA